MTASNNDARRKPVARAADHDAEPNEEFELDIDVSFDDDEEDYLDEADLDIDEDDLLGDLLIDDDLVEESVFDEEDFLDAELIEDDLLDEEVVLELSDDDFQEDELMLSVDDSHVESIVDDVPADEGVVHLVESHEALEALIEEEEQEVFELIEEEPAPPPLPPPAPARPTGEQRILARVNVVKSSASMSASPQSASRELELRNQELQGECMALETQLDTARATLEHQRRDLDVLKQSLQAAQDVDAQRQRDLDALKQSLQAAQDVDAQRQRAEALLQEAEAQGQAAQERLAELQAELEGGRAALAESEASAAQRAAESQSRFEALEASMAAAQEEAAQQRGAFEQQVEALKERLAAVTSQQAQQALDAEAQQSLHAEAQQALRLENDTLRSRVEGLEPELEAAQQQVDAYHQDVARLEKANEELRGDLEGLSQERADDQAKVRALEEDNKARDEQLAELGAEKESLSVELNGAHEELRALSARLDTTLQQQGALEDRLRDLDLARERSEAAFESLKDEHNALHGKHAELLERFAQFREESDNVAAALGGERDALRAQTETLREEVAQQAQAMDAMRVEHEQVFDELVEQTAQERQALERERDASHQAVEAVRAEMAQVRAEGAELSHALTEAQAAHQALSVAHERAQAELAERPTREALLELQSLTDDLDQQRTHLQGELEQVTHQGQRLGAEYQELAEVYESLQREHVDRGQQLMGSLADGERQRAELTRVSGELSAVRDEVSALAVQNQALQARNDQLQAHNAQLQSQLEALRAQAERLAVEPPPAPSYSSPQVPIADAGNVDDILDDALEETAEQLAAMGLVEASTFEEQLSGATGMSAQGADDDLEVDDNAAPRMSSLGASDERSAQHEQGDADRVEPAMSPAQPVEASGDDLDDLAFGHGRSDRVAAKPISPVGRSTSRYRFVHDEQFEHDDDDAPAIDVTDEAGPSPDGAHFLDSPDSYADYDVSEDDFGEVVDFGDGQELDVHAAAGALVDEDDFGAHLFGAADRSLDRVDSYSDAGELRDEVGEPAAFDEQAFVADDFGDDADFGAEFVDPFEHHESHVAHAADPGASSSPNGLSVGDEDLAMLVSSTLGDEDMHRLHVDVADADLLNADDPQSSPADGLEDPLEYLQSQGLMDLCPHADFAMARGVDHRAGFLLAMANGSTTTRDIIELSGGVLEGSTAARLVLNLFNSGALSV